VTILVNEFHQFMHLETFVALTEYDITRVDFSDVVGRWNSDEEFDRVMATLRDIHPEDWE
jgi:hypothetical protein